MPPSGRFTQDSLSGLHDVFNLGSGLLTQQGLEILYFPFPVNARVTHSLAQATITFAEPAGPSGIVTQDVQAVLHSVFGLDSGVITQQGLELLYSPTP